MTTRHRHVVKEDVGIRVAPSGRDVGIEQETRTGVGSPADDEECRSGRQGTDGVLLLRGDLAIEGGKLLLEILAVVCRRIRQAGISRARICRAGTVRVRTVPIFRTNHREPPSCC